MSVFIIAEAGVNHNGSLNIAKKLIDIAATAGADAVKFQSFLSKNIATKKTPKAKYQKNLTSHNETHYDMLRKLELSKKEHIDLINYCKKRNIIFLSSPFDIESINLLDELGLDIYKIPSGEITNLPYLRHIGKLKKKIILSTGLSTINEVKDALNILIQSGTEKSNVILLHTNTEYPTPMEDVNLRAMVTMGNDLDIKFGYSDHTLGIEVDIAAVAMGAICIEKHFTLDCDMDGPDHKASLEPNQLTDMVKAIRNVEKALGSNLKKPSRSELSNLHTVRKSLVAKTKIKKGELFRDSNLTVKRPGSGISPMEWDNIIGTKAQIDYEEDDLI